MTVTSSGVRLASPGPGLLVLADQIRVDAARGGEVDGQALEADDVHDRMRLRENRDFAAKLAERSLGVARALGGATSAFEDETPHAGVDRGEMAM